MVNLIVFLKTFQCLYEKFECNAYLMFILNLGHNL
jgi:hypothetical protein